MKLKDGSIALVEPEIDGVYPPEEYEARKKKCGQDLQEYLKNNQAGKTSVVKIKKR